MSSHNTIKMPKKHVEVSKKSEQKLKRLKKEFQQRIIHLESSTEQMEPRQKSLVSDWISKLKSHPPNLKEAIVRNRILSEMLPFLSIKSADMLPPHSNTLSGHGCKNNNINELLNFSLDDSGFLHSLPIPRNGAFFIIHLTSNL